jgi:hypothetical protein
LKRGYGLEGLTETSNRKRNVKTFSYFDNEIHLFGNPISKQNFFEVRRILNRQVIPNNSERSYLESIIGVIADQGINYGESVKFMKSLHSLPMGKLRDSKIIHKMAKESGLKGSSRNKFQYFYNYVEKNGGINEVAKNYLENPHEMREELSKIRGMGMKRASLWYLALGGDKDLMVLDSHSLSQAEDLGIEITNKKRSLNRSQY